ncbi:MAG: WbqC family protein [Ghiorsea sp.]|nr:WbqC family protein [Ghiorsea sp.]
MKIITIHQPNYMPWSGFFHKWELADAFVILDTVQFHKNEWQNRNRIKTKQGEQWITVPVTYRFPQLIHEVGIAPNNWAKKQIASIEQAYAKSPYLDEYWQPIKSILQQKHDKLVDLNVALIRTLGHMLGCTSPLYLASDLPVDIAEPTERLIQITQHLQGDVYLSGAEGRNYLQPSAFTGANIKLLFQQCTPPSYPQMHGDFIPYLSVLDVLLNIGEDAKALIANMGDMQP